jgi:hypothetical protein
MISKSKGGYQWMSLAVWILGWYIFSMTAGIYNKSYLLKHGLVMLFTAAQVSTPKTFLKLLWAYK